MTYRALGASHAAGSGETVDVSSSGVRFNAEHELAVGMKLELTMKWPAPLEGSIPLQLRLVGTTVRTGDRQAALVIDHHEFRTTKRSGSAESGRPGDSRLSG